MPLTIQEPQSNQELISRLILVSATITIIHDLLHKLILYLSGYSNQSLVKGVKSRLEPKVISQTFLYHNSENTIEIIYKGLVVISD